MGFFRPRHLESLTERLVMCDECFALILKEESYGHDQWHLTKDKNQYNDKKDDEKNSGTDVHSDLPVIEVDTQKKVF